MYKGIRQGRKDVTSTLVLWGLLQTMFISGSSCTLLTSMEQLTVQIIVQIIILFNTNLDKIGDYVQIMSRLNNYFLFLLYYYIYCWWAFSFLLYDIHLFKFWKMSLSFLFIHIEVFCILLFTNLFLFLNIFITSFHW